MSETMQVAPFKSALNMLFDEAFEQVHGIFLDRGTSMFETLATISAETASIPVGGRCATLAAQVTHVAFYLDVTEQMMRGQTLEPVDWGEIWRETGAVSAEEWQQIQADLRESYGRIRALVADTAEWTNDRQIGGAIACIVHTAYHLGEIRQALCTLISAETSDA